VNYDNKTICILGGSGSFGEAYVKHVLNKSSKCKIVAVGKSESKIVVLRRMISSPHLSVRIGDIKDVSFLDRVLADVDFVIHAAALKHVDICEENIVEAINTNVVGTINVLNAAVKNNVSHVINLSADKAISPVGVYGATKLLTESLFKHYHSTYGGKNIKFDSVRYSNIINSSGSAALLFRDRLKEGQEVRVFDPNMFRHFLTQQDLIGSVEFLLKHSRGGLTAIPLSQKIRISDMAKVIFESVGRGSLRIDEANVRSWEKKDAQILSETELDRTLIWNQKLLLVCHSARDLNEYQKYAHIKQFPMSQLKSYGKIKFQSRQDIKSLLQKVEILT